MATIYTHASANIRKTWLLLSLLFVFLIGFFWVLSVVWQNPAILWFGTLLAIITNVASYWFSDKLVIALSGARPTDVSQAPELYHVVENLTITAGLPMPRIYIVNNPARNAFA